MFQDNDLKINERTSETQLYNCTKSLCLRILLDFCKHSKLSPAQRIEELPLLNCTENL
jgi:hypothetical protein